MTLRTVFLLLQVALLAQSALAQPGPCDGSEARQFDFWVGSWEVHAGGKVAGHNTISAIHGGCTLLEEYSAAEGPYEGKSFNWFDPLEGLWHQVWVDNGGTRLDLSGGLKEGSMVMAGARQTAQGEVTDRISWTPLEGGTVRQHWELSSDGGETWKTLFDGLYRPVEED